MWRNVAASLMFAVPLTALPADGAGQGPDLPPRILSPDRGERVPADQVLVAVSFPDAGDAAGALDVRIRVGARDVSAEAELRGGVLTWRPRDLLPPGPHRVVVAARRADGAVLPPLDWTFAVAPAERRRADAAASPAAHPRPRRPGFLPHGSVVVEGAGSAVGGSGAPLRREEDFVRRMWINAGGELRPGWRYTAHAHVSGYESADRQPVNRFRADLRGPGMWLAGGDVNPVLHDIILAGRHVRGAQADLRAGPARLDVVVGRSRRAIPGRLDPLDTSLVFRTGTYEQNVLAVRPSLGAGDRFRVGLTLLRVRDETSSIPDLRTSPDPGGLATRSANPAPQDNLVAGVDATLRLAQGRIAVQYENALSVLARDRTGGALDRAALDSVFVSFGRRPPGIDGSRWERWFTLNGSLTPLDPRGLTSTAHQLRTTFRAGGHHVAVEWHTVGVDYHSLGHPGIQRDRRGIRVRDTFTALGDALFVTAVYVQDRDNLGGSALATTTSRAGQVAAHWQAPGDALLLTGSLRLGARANGLAPEAAGALDETTAALTAGASVPVAVMQGLRTRLTLNGAYVSRSDPANPFAASRDLYYLGGIQGETVARTTDFSLLLGQSRATIPAAEHGGSVVQRALAMGRHRLTARWKARVDGAVTAASSSPVAGAPGPRYLRTETTGGGEFAWTGDAVVSFGAGVITYADRRDSGMDTREVVARLRVSRAF
jgi:hypothetical protein